MQLNTSNNQVPLKFAARYWIEDNNGCAMCTQGKFNYTQRTHKAKNGKVSEESIPSPFVPDGRFYASAKFSKALQRLQKLCKDDPRLNPKWFKISSGRFLIHHN